MKRNALRYVLLSCLLASVGGCGSDAAPRNLRCEIDPTLLAAERACVEDDDCPCGAGCNLGACTATCTANDQCADGERCNEFGRCSVDDGSFIPVLRAGASAGDHDLLISRTLIESTTGDDVQRFAIRAPSEHAAATRLRIVPEAGLAIACGRLGATDAAAATTADCQLQVEDGIEVAVVPAAPLSPGSSLGVGLYWNTRRDRVTYHYPGGAASFEPDGAPAGRYEGSARLVRVGAGIVPATAEATTGLDGTSGGVANELELEAPISMEVFDATGGWLVRVHDPLGALTPERELHAFIEDTGAELRWVTDSHPYITTALVTTADDVGKGFKHLDARYGYRTEAAGTPTDEIVWPTLDRAKLEGGVATFDLPVYFDNLRRPQRAPAAVWRIAVTRQGALPENATAPSAPAGTAAISAAALDLDTRLDATRWEAGLMSKIGDPKSIVDTWLTPETASYNTGDASAESLPLCAHARAIDAADRAAWEDELNTRAVAAGFTATLDGDYDGATIRVAGRVESVTLPYPAPYNRDSNAFVDSVIQSIQRSPNHDFGTDRITVDYELSIRAPARHSTSHIEIPCAIRFGFTVNPFSGLPLLFNQGGGTGLRCNELAEQLGGVAFYRPSSAYYQIKGSSGNGDMTVQRFETSGSPNGAYNTRWAIGINYAEVLGYVVIPRIPAACTDVVQCHSGEQVDGLTSSLLAGDYYSETGDAICTGSYRSLALDADDNAGSLSAGSLFAACVDDLSRIDDPLVATDDLYAALTRSSCINYARLFPALSAASYALRNQDIGDYNWPNKAANNAIAQRLLARWVSVHGFVAHELAQQQALASALRRAPVAGTPALPQIADVLPTSLRGWDLLLHPRFAAALDNMSGALLAAPDYRIARFGGSLPDDVADDPAHGLPETMLDTLRAQIELATRAVEQARFRGDQSVLELMSPVVRYSAVVGSLAEELTARAVAACVADPDVCNGGSEPLWYARYVTARSRTGVALARLLAQVASLRSGANPFGIQDSDLPIYFADSVDSDASRFFAISDYFVGTSPEDIGAWAPPLIEDAEHHLGIVRSRWVERQDRDAQTQRDALDRQTRVVAAQVGYGERIINLCGRPGSLLPGDVLQNWEQHHGLPFDSATCYLNRQLPECRNDLTETLDLYGDDEVRYSVCYFRELDRLTGGAAAYGDPLLTDFARACADADTTYVATGCAESPTGACLRCADEAVPPAVAAGGSFLEVGTTSTANFTALTSASDACRARYPSAVVPLPSLRDKVGDLPTACFRGAIGEQAAAMRSVATEIAIARAELAELEEAHGIALEACRKEQETGKQLIGLQEALNEEKTKLRAIKLAADVAASVAESVSDCAGHVSDIDATPGDAAKDSGAATVGCAAEAVQAVAESVSAGMQFAIDQADSKFDLETLQVEVRGAFELCTIEAKQYRVGVKSQALRIQRAMQDLEAASVARVNLLAEADLWYEDGLGTVAFEQERRISPMTQDLWIDEALSDWVRSYRLAHRVTYLAAVAVEYEFQQSLGLPEQALAAELPVDLRAVLQELRTLTGPRSVFGSRPVARKVVLSLRDDLLALADYSDAPPEELGLTATERLQLRLTSPNSAVYDDDGTYLGQQLEFSLAPSSASGGAFEGTPITSQDSCAERLWSLNASIQGGVSLLYGSQSSFTDLTLKKANTFFSQWCDGDDGDSEFQVVSVRPERNLFRDPEHAGASFIEAQLSALRDANSSKALIQPELNVPRADFEDDAFENGESSQLAGRGLFGEYAIFFPAQTLSVMTADGQTNGLDLSKVDDVLIRFDYVAAAR